MKKINIENPIVWKIPHEILMWKFNLKYSHLYVKILIKFKCG